MMKWVANKTKSMTGKTTALMAMAMLALMAFASSAFAAPSTGDTDVDSALSALEAAFSTLKTGFWYLALAAIPITLAVLAFFWLRGKFKQAVSGA